MNPWMLLELGTRDGQLVPWAIPLRLLGGLLLTPAAPEGRTAPGGWLPSRGARGLQT